MSRQAFATYRDEILDRAEALGWPELIIEGVGRVEGEVGSKITVELSTADHLIRMSRALLEASLA